MLKTLIAILTISLILLYASLSITESNGESLFANRSHNTINFFREAGDRFWEFDWVYNRDRISQSDRLDI